MIYKIFPTKDASIYSYFPSKNTGIDEILDVNPFLSPEGTYEVSRTLVEFDQNEIHNIISNQISGSGANVFLKLYLANASELPIRFPLQIFPVYQSWDMGTGRFYNNPETSNGITWGGPTEFTSWNLTSLPTGVTCSYISGSGKDGGGNWYYNYNCSQSIEYTTSKDINIDVSSIVKDWYSGSIDNNGFIIKNSNQLEFTTGSIFDLKYFSRDTHTIYPPCLEFRWDDSIYNTGSGILVSSDDIVLTLQNNKEIYGEESIHRFRLGARPRFPVRTFQTSSIYANNYILPETSYWSIKDHKTEDTIVDFDINYTKISIDSTNEKYSYFDVCMNGLEPERWYRLLFKVVINGTVNIFDNNYLFKVVRDSDESSSTPINF